MRNVPSITPRVKLALGSSRRVAEVLEGDDAPESMAFMATWNKLSDKDKEKVRLEDVIIASGLSIRRFWEVLNGALMDFSAQTTKLIIAEHQPEVMKATIKAAVDSVPITETRFEDGVAVHEVVGWSNGDVNAQKLFHTITGALPTPKGSTFNFNVGRDQQQDDSPKERTPLQSMDAFLLDIQNIARPKQLNAPVEIPVEMPENAPEIEYLNLED